VSDITPDKQNSSDIYFGDAAYWRIKLCQILPPELKYCIYTDYDVLFLKPLDELANIDFGNKWVAVVGNKCFKHNEKNWEKYFKEISEAGQEFNSGVMVFNLEQWRAQEVWKKFIPLKEMDFACAEQPRLNIVCFGHNVMLDPIKYNAWGGEDIEQTCVILHFAGHDTKPWKGCPSECKKLWWEYAKITPFYGILKDEYLREISKK